MDNSIPYLQYFMDNFSDHQPLSTRMAKAQKSACAFKRCFKIEKDDQFMQGVFQQKGSKFIPMIMIQIPHVCKT